MFKKWFYDWWGQFPPIRKRNEAQAANELRRRELARIDAESERAEQEAHANVGERLAAWKEQTEWTCSRCKRSVKKADWVYLKNYNLWQCQTEYCGNLKRDVSGPALAPRPDPDGPKNPFSE